MKRIHWPTALLLIVALLLIWATLLFGPALGMPEGLHGDLVAAVGSVGVLLAAWLPKVFGKDADGDFIPDIIDADGGQGDS